MTVFLTGIVSKLSGFFYPLCVRTYCHFNSWFILNM